MIKRVSTEDGLYNAVFDTSDGMFLRWGKTEDEDPLFCPIGPEIADVEISTICNGVGKTIDRRKPCSHCYKSNTGRGKNMSLDTFKTIFGKFPRNLTQIAFGIGDIDGNPDLFNIMEHCRKHDVVPNLTVNGMGIDKSVSRRLAELCGAVAVSHYGIDEVCFEAVERLSDAGLRQVNIHKLVARETSSQCIDLIYAAAKGAVKGLNAIVFLMLKPKGDRNTFHKIEMEDYERMIKLAVDSDVKIGMDSCSAPMVMKILSDSISSIEPCESGLFSIYVNVDGEAFPCSFTEKTPGWEVGIDLKYVFSFKNDVWFSSRMREWREMLLLSSYGCKSCEMRKSCRSCPAFDITMCKEK